MNKTKLRFMVVPEDLKKYAYVPDKVEIKITDEKKMGMLGESGRKLAKMGVSFYFTRKLADMLIKNKTAKLVKHRGVEQPGSSSGS